MKKITFNSYDELMDWCNSHPLDIVYWGHIENFDKFDVVDELKKEASPDWFDEGMTADIYVDDEWSATRDIILKFFDYYWEEVLPLYEDGNREEAVEDALSNDSPYFDDETNDYMSWRKALATAGGMRK